MTTEIALPLCYEFLIFLGKLEEACVSLMPACSQSEKTHLANAVAKNVKLLLAVLAPRIRVLVWIPAPLLLFHSLLMHTGKERMIIQHPGPSNPGENLGELQDPDFSSGPWPRLSCSGYLGTEPRSTNRGHERFHHCLHIWPILGKISWLGKIFNDWWPPDFYSLLHFASHSLQLLPVRT